MYNKYFNKKKTKGLNFFLSQKAHKRLKKKFDKLSKTDTSNYDKYFIKYSYHTKCFNIQEKTGHLLTPVEKKNIYNQVIDFFY